jgi:two-component system response regulator
VSRLESFTARGAAGALALLNTPLKKSMNNKIFDILLIEDDADDAELTIHALKKYNLANRILHIDDGEKALDFLFSPHEKPTLILLDLKMPRVDGIQILRRLKSDPAKEDIPVVALISSKDGKSYVESFSIKADAYLIKPVDFKKFCVAVTEVGITSMILSSSQVDDKKHGPL